MPTVAMRDDTSRKGIGGRPRGEPTAVVRLPVPVVNLARRLREGTLRETREELEEAIAGYAARGREDAAAVARGEPANGVRPH
jgi:hypothetical protein